MRLIDLEDPAHVFCGEHGEYENWNIDPDVQTIDAVPVRHGRWIKNGNSTYTCSECQSWIPNEQRYYARYCLHCGARMDEDE